MSDAFDFILPKEKSSFGFCLCSELLQVKFGITNLAPKSVTGLTKVSLKDIYHIYNFVDSLQFQWSCIVGVRVAQSKGKTTKIEAWLRTQKEIFI